MKHQRINLSNYKPPSKVYTIIHSQYYIKSGSEQSLRRNIFHSVQYDKFEQQLIESLKQKVKLFSIELPPQWKDVDFLKMIHSARFNINSAIDNLHIHLKWLNQMEKLNTDNKGIIDQIYENYLVYICGHDKQYRPVIIIKYEESQMDKILLALEYLLYQITQQILIPYFLEKWTIILDMNNQLIDYQNFNIQMLMKIVRQMQINFCSNLNTLLIINTHVDFEKNMKNLSYVTQFSSIKVIQNHQQLLSYINQNQLQTNYGGTLHSIQWQYQSKWIDIFRPPENSQDIEEFSKSTKMIFLDTQFRELQKFQKLGKNNQGSISVGTFKNNSMRIVVHEENGNSLIDEEFDELSIDKEYQEDDYYQNQMKTNTYTKGWTQNQKTLLEKGRNVESGCCSQNSCSIF